MEKIAENLNYIADRLIKQARLVQKHREDSGKKEWALVSKSTAKVLKWFGTTKPSDEAVQKEERRVQFFKHQ